eukprot:TRINITY_DN20292_c2_g3_i1.p1 TRINITY_DN20292_c2_g3~~TRINITY_DN20292_c2_g3_i1.p1  ORF type:complete len:492 (+),score=98.77 TRINITY_DN20292_c2_g3_i1:71-1546(+)
MARPFARLRTLAGLGFLVLPNAVADPLEKQCLLEGVLQGVRGSCGTQLSSGQSCQISCEDDADASGELLCMDGTLAWPRCRSSCSTRGSAPAHGSLGNCPEALSSGASCTPLCRDGFVLRGRVSCRGGQLVRADCVPVHEEMAADVFLSAGPDARSSSSFGGLLPSREGEVVRSTVDGSRGPSQRSWLRPSQFLKMFRIPVQDMSRGREASTALRATVEDRGVRQLQQPVDDPNQQEDGLDSWAIVGCIFVSALIPGVSCRCLQMRCNPCPVEDGDDSQSEGKAEEKSAAAQDASQGRTEDSGRKSENWEAYEAPEVLLLDSTREQPSDDELSDDGCFSKPLEPAEADSPASPGPTTTQQSPESYAQSTPLLPKSDEAMTPEIATPFASQVVTPSEVRQLCPKVPKEKLEGDPYVVPCNIGSEQATMVEVQLKAFNESKAYLVSAKHMRGDLAPTPAAPTNCGLGCGTWALCGTSPPPDTIGLTSIQAQSV